MLWSVVVVVVAVAVAVVVVVAVAVAVVVVPYPWCCSVSWFLADGSRDNTIKRLQAWEAFHFLSVTYCTPVLCALLRAGFMYFEES